MRHCSRVRLPPASGPSATPPQIVTMRFCCGNSTSLGIGSGSSAPAGPGSASTFEKWRRLKAGISARAVGRMERDQAGPADDAGEQRR